MIKEGDPFPEFSLQDQDGNLVSSSDLVGQKTIVYFYPKDDTSGCTVEACEFQAALPDFGTANVLGVSPDPIDSHAKFAAKHGLSFRLLADVERSLIEPLGLWVEKTLYGNKYMGVARTTFLVGENGSIQRIWRDVKPEGHAAEVLAAYNS